MPLIRHLYILYEFLTLLSGAGRLHCTQIEETSRKRPQSNKAVEQTPLDRDVMGSIPVATNFFSTILLEAHCTDRNHSALLDANTKLDGFTFPGGKMFRLSK